LSKPAVIVISSHVVRGSVGGRASVFALERLGFPVWSVPTVVLPWHPGHGRGTRVPVPAADFAALVADLAGSKWLGEVGAVLSGYLGSAEQAEAIARLVAALKQRNPSALYLCDPIVGDSHGLFQPEAVVAAIRERLLPRADILTPNRHELGWLAGRSVGNNGVIVAAVRALGIGEAAVTSAFAPAGEIGTLIVARDEASLVTHRRIADVPHGTGDLFAALHLGHRLDGVAPVDAAAQAASSVLRLIELAAETNSDEMPLAAGQGAFLARTENVTVVPMAQAGGGSSRNTPSRNPR
jgi:pyridoxine kinase